jgi:hypothetical protein
MRVSSVIGGTGGWVLLLGSPSMMPRPPRPRRTALMVTTPF